MKSVKTLLLSILLFANFTPMKLFSASSSNYAVKAKEVTFPFDGVFGKFDYNSIQRGFKIYREICSSCHSIKLFAYRDLANIGYSKEEIKQIASEYDVIDGPNDDGDMFIRPGLPSDKFISPYKNDNLARKANAGALPPDLSLITKARLNGANYVYSLLVGYKNAPENFHLTEGKYYNPYFEGRQIGMVPPLADEIIEYEDGIYPSTEQLAYDIVNFLQFIAEPEMEDRKSMGIRVMIFLFITAIFFIISKKIIWSNVK